MTKDPAEVRAGGTSGGGDRVGRVSRRAWEVWKMGGVETVEHAKWLKGSYQLLCVWGVSGCGGGGGYVTNCCVGTLQINR